MKKLALLLPLILFFSACKKDDSKPAQPNIYIGGMEGIVGFYSNAKYWKNGVETMVSDAGVNNTYAYAMAVSGTDVYLVGEEMYGGSKCWKNGLPIALTDVTNVSLNSIAIDGSDLYFAGNGYSYSNTNGVAMYWKNGVAIPLSDGSSNANVNSIVISEKDVYVVGDEAYGVKYWKNGIPVEITHGDDLASGVSIAVSGSDVYVLGYENSPDGYQAKCWKNGTPIFTDNEVTTWVHKVIVVGNDVYICGTRENKAVYWKNGVAVWLTDGTHLADAKDITAYKDDIYVVGYEEAKGMFMDVVRVAKYWKNGVATNFGRVGIDNNDPRSIVVK